MIVQLLFHCFYLALQQISGQITSLNDKNNGAPKTVRTYSAHGRKSGLLNDIVNLTMNLNLEWM